MGTMRRVLAGLGVLVLLLAGAFGHFLYAPSPAAPRLGASVRRDSLRVGERTRSYAFHAPARLAPHPPLVLALHGSMGDAEQMREATGYGFERLADRHGFVVVYPEGYEGHWNDCRREGPYAAKRLGIDDVGFVRALVARFRSAYGADSARVFAVGPSTGGTSATGSRWRPPGWCAPSRRSGRASPPRKTWTAPPPRERLRCSS